jgi:hypothetical protein
MKARVALLVALALMLLVFPVGAEETTSLRITSVWQGGFGGELKLTLYADGKRVDPQPEYVVSGDEYLFEDLPRYTASGRRIVYSVKEHYFEGYTAMYVNKKPYYSDTRRVYDRGVIINRATDYYTRD